MIDIGWLSVPGVSAFSMTDVWTLPLIPKMFLVDLIPMGFKSGELWWPI